MEMRDYIEAGIRKFGTATQLAKELGMNANQVRDAKAHRCGLPVYACIRLADLIGVDPMEVIAASELVTEKHEDRIAVFRPFVQAARFAQHLMIAGLAVSASLAVIVENSASTIRTFLL